MAMVILTGCPNCKAKAAGYRDEKGNPNERAEKARYRRAPGEASIYLFPAVCVEDGNANASRESPAPTRIYWRPSSS